MEDDFDLVFAQYPLQQMWTAKTAAHYLDPVSETLVHEFAGGNPVAYQRRQGRALLQQVFRQPSAHQSRGASDKDTTVAPEAIRHYYCSNRIIPAKLCRLSS